MGKTILMAIAALGCVAAMCGAGPARAQDVFSSGSAGSAGRSSARTGTQGVTGNPNCPSPVPGLANWSCPTGTQNVLRQPSAPVTGGRYVQGRLVQTPSYIPQRTTQGRSPYNTGTRPVPVFGQPSYNPYRNLPPAVTAEQQARVQAAQNRLQNGTRTQIFNGLAPSAGLPQVQFGPARSQMRY